MDPASPVTGSPTISISTLSDFTIANNSDDGSPVEPTTITLHDTFYLGDGNVEVLCGDLLFRVHTSVSSLDTGRLEQSLSKPPHSLRGGDRLKFFFFRFKAFDHERYGFRISCGSAESCSRTSAALASICKTQIPRTSGSPLETTVSHHSIILCLVGCLRERT